MKLKRLLLLCMTLLLSPLLYADVCVTSSAVVPASGGGAVGSLSLSNPGSQAGDLLLAQVVVSDQGVNVSPPSGWTRYSEVGTGGGGGVYQGLFYRVASASEASSYSFSWNGGNRATGGLLVLRGVALVAGVPQLSVQSSSGFDSSLVAPSVTVAEANSRVLRFFAFGAGNTAINPPELEHYSSATTQAGPNGVVAAASSLLQGTSGASGTASATVSSGSDDWVATTLVSRPDPNSSASCGGTGVDHYRLSFASNQALTCNPLSVTLQACQNSSCSTLYASPVTVNLTPSGAPNNWSVTPLTFTGSTSVQFQRTTPATVTLGLTGTPVASNATQCIVGGVSGSCAVTFADSGFIFDVPNTLAAKPTPATLRAVKKDDQTQACVPGFASGTRTVAFSRLYSDPVTGTQPVLVNGTAVTSNTPVTLNFDANASAPLLVRYDDAGLMTLNASFSGSGNEAGLSLTGSDQFVAKPYGLCLQTDSTCSSADANCAVFPGVRAGDSFPLRIRAVGWQADGEALTAAQLCTGNITTPNFLHAGIALSSAVQAPVGGTNGAMSPTTYAHALGSQTTSNTTISEVGVFTITATPPTGGYLGGETVSGGSSALVGRFIPAYLGAVGSASLTPSCGSAFSYQGQPMDFANTRTPTLAITGFNRAGVVTSNYDRGAFWKLATPAVGVYSSATGTSVDARLLTQGTPSLSIEGADDGDGTRAYRWSGEQLLYSPGLLPTAEDVPFMARVNQTFAAASLTDADGACYGAGAACEGFSYAFSDDPGSEVRLGRLRIGNAHGSELQALNLPLTIETWQATGAGNSFAPEGLDNCTAAVLGAPVLDGFTGSLAAGETTPSLSGPTAGVGVIGLTAPGAGNEGSVRGSFLPALPPTWLYYDWSGNGREMASGLATFGIYRGAPPLIFRRELYR